MDTNASFRGPFSDAALAKLFLDNTPPTQPEIIAAAQDARTYCDVASRLIGMHPAVSGQYIREQAVYGPLVRLMGMVGWNLSGSGYFSVAFHKGGLALKIGLRPADDLALTYLHWCTDNGDLAGVPTVYALGEGERAYAAVMDRYSSVAHELDEESALYDPHLYSEFEQVRMAVEHGKSGNYPVSHTGAYIHREFRGQGNFDITVDNVMVDRNGRMVITDPIASYDYSLSERTSSSASR